MKAFRWDPCFLTGLPTVDEQHHYLVDIINQFGDALMRPKGASAAEIEALFEELRRYTLYHFQEEEALMASSGVYRPALGLEAALLENQQTTGYHAGSRCRGRLPVYLS